MHRILPLALLLGPFLAPYGAGSPIDGGAIETKKFDIAEPWRKTVKFRGGERACVMAVGIRRGEAGALQITVHDKNDVLVAEDKGSGLAGDCVAAIWYPPRDGDYRITVTNLNPGPTACFITVK